MGNKIGVKKVSSGSAATKNTNAKEEVAPKQVKVSKIEKNMKAPSAKAGIQAKKTIKSADKLIKSTGKTTKAKPTVRKDITHIKRQITKVKKDSHKVKADAKAVSKVSSREQLVCANYSCTKFIKPTVKTPTAKANTSKPVKDVV